MAGAVGRQVLIEGPQAELRQVHSGQQAILAKGAFSISAVDDGRDARVVAQVGGTSWEVLPHSQTLRAGELTYVFSTDTEGLFYAVTLGADTTPEALGILEAVLESVSLLRESQRLLRDPAAQAGETALSQGVTYRHSLARGVHRAGSALAAGLMVSATYATLALSKASSHLTSGPATNQPVQVSEGFKRRMEMSATAAKWASKAANKVAGALAWCASKVAKGVVWAVGPSNRLPSGDESGLGREVSRAAINGFVEVWDAMEQAGLLVLTSVRNNTVKVVEHRYGAGAAVASTHSMDALGHTADVLMAAKRIGVRAVAKATAKQAASGVLKKWSGQDGRAGPQPPLQPPGPPPGDTGASCSGQPQWQ